MAGTATVFSVCLTALGLRRGFSNISMVATAGSVWPPLVDSGRIAWPDDVSAEVFVADLVPGLFFLLEMYSMK